MGGLGFILSLTVCSIGLIGVVYSCDISGYKTCYMSFTSHVKVLTKNDVFSAFNLDYDCRLYSNLTSCSRSLNMHDCNSTIAVPLKHFNAFFDYVCGEGRADFKKYSSCFQKLSADNKWKKCAGAAKNLTDVCLMYIEIVKCNRAKLGDFCGQRASDVYNKIYSELYLSYNAIDSCNNAESQINDVRLTYLTLLAAGLRIVTALFQYTG